MGQAGSCGNGNKWLDSGYILKVKLVGFSAVRAGRKRVKDNAEVFIPVSWNMENTENRKPRGGDNTCK